jgi:hypothetical protein
MTTETQTFTERSNRRKDLETYNRRHRERQRSHVPKVGQRQLTLFRKDSHREELLDTTACVVCRECGAKLKVLAGGAWPHLRLVHNLTADEYHKHWSGAPLMSRAHRNELALRGTKQMASAQGRPRRGIRVRGHEGPMRKWPIVCGLVQGHSYEKIGEDLKRTTQTVKAAVDRLGLAGRAALYDFGLPVTGAIFSQIKAASGLSAKELAQQTQLSKSGMAEWILPRYSRHRVTPKSASKLIEWRDGALRRLLSDVSKPSRGFDRHSGSALLKTLVPGLRHRYNLLLPVLRRLRKCLLTNTSWGVSEIQDYLCDQAMLEVAGKSESNLLTKFLPWTPELMPFLEANIDRLRGRGNLFPIAYEAIAGRWDTTPHVVAAAIKPRNHVSAPEPVTAQTLSFDTLYPVRNPRGAGRKPTKTSIYAEAKILHEKEGLSWPKIANRLTLSDYAANPRKAADAIRKGVSRL